MTKSIVPLFPQDIDNRSLSMDARFYMLKIEDMKRLALFFLDFVKETIEPHVIIRSQCNRKKRFHLDISKEINATPGEIEFSFEGDYSSSVVHNTKSFRQFDKYIMYEWHPRKAMPNNYEIFFKKNFTCDESNWHTIQSRVIELFSVSGKIPTSGYARHEIIGCFHSLPYWFHSGMYYGQFRLSIAKECLGSEVTKVAEDMATFLECAANEICNIGGTVRLAPYSYDITPYMYYFGNHYIMDGSHELAKCYPNEWYPFYHHDGIEWFNLLTRYAAEKVNLSLSENPAVNCKKLAHGGLTVKMSESIEKADISDYEMIKNHLYNALIPGSSQISLKNLLDPQKLGYLAKPRMDWEIIPVSSEEICVKDGCVIFKHVI